MQHPNIVMQCRNVVVQYRNLALPRSPQLHLQHRSLPLSNLLYGPPLQLHMHQQTCPVINFEYKRDNTGSARYVGVDGRQTQQAEACKEAARSREALQFERKASCSAGFSYHRQAQ